MTAPDLRETYVRETCAKCGGCGFSSWSCWPKSHTGRDMPAGEVIPCTRCHGEGRQLRHAYDETSGEQAEKEREP